MSIGKVQPHKWENAMTIDRRSWGFRREAPLSDYLNIEDLITILAETVRSAST
jgi:alpha-L-fucosidase